MSSQITDWNSKEVEESYKKMREDIDKMFIEHGHWYIEGEGGRIPIGGPIPHFYSNGRKYWDTNAIRLFKLRIEYLKAKDVKLFQEVNEVIYLEKEIENNEQTEENESN